MLMLDGATGLARHIMFTELGFNASSRAQWSYTLEPYQRFQFN